MSSLFDFLEEYDKQAFKYAKFMESTLYEQPMAALGYGGRFIESIRNSLYTFHHKAIIKLRINIDYIDKNLVSFKKEDLSKHISDLRNYNLIKNNLYNKMINSYQIRHAIHLNNDADSIEQDKKAALTLYREIFEIALLYCEHIDPNFYKLDYKFKLPSKTKEEETEIPEIIITKIFDNCIVCGNENPISNRNLCPDCKRKIRIAKNLADLIDIMDTTYINETFLKINSYDKYEIRYLYHYLDEFGLINRKSGKIDSDIYLKDKNILYDFIEEAQKFDDNEKKLLAFYNELIDFDKLDYSENSPYSIGKQGGIYQEYYYLIVDKKVKHYLTLKLNNSPLAVEKSGVTREEVMNWYSRKVQFIKDIKYKQGQDLSFDKLTDILLKKWISYRSSGWSKEKIKNQLLLTDNILNYWFNTSIKVDNEKFSFKNNAIEMRLFSEAIAIGNSKEEAMKIADVDDKFIKSHFNLMNEEGIKHKCKNINEYDIKHFYSFKAQYFNKKIKIFLNSLKGESLEFALEEAELPIDEFNEWYKIGRNNVQKSTKNKYYDFVKFYLDTTQIFLDNWLDKRREGFKKTVACREIGLDPVYLEEWFKFKEFKFDKSKFGCFKEFESTDDLTKMFNKFYLAHDQIILDSIKKYVQMELNSTQIANKVDVSSDLIGYIFEESNNGNERYSGIYKEFKEIHSQKDLDKFIDVFCSSDDFNKALKKSKLSKEYIDEICELGKNGDEKYSKFYKKFLNTQLKVYAFVRVNHLNKKKALKNTHLTNEIVDKYSNELEMLSLLSRMDNLIISRAKQKRLEKILKSLSLTKDIVKYWYLRGQELITDDEYTSFKDLKEEDLVVLIERIPKMDTYEFNNHTSYDECYKMFYNYYQELFVLPVSKKISYNINGDSGFLKFLLNELRVTKEEFRYWDSMGWIDWDKNSDEEDDD